MEERVTRFAALFRGSPRGHGRYEVAPVSQNGHGGGKLEGHRWTAHEPLTEKLFGLHLAGATGVGAVPLLLDPPGTTVWCAIDVDDYALDLVTFTLLVVSLNLPVTVCRTKSGGAHVYVFFSEPVGAVQVRKKLRTWCTSLGYPNAEIFPKQNSLGATEEDGDSYWGNWINLPYQGGDRSTRYALDDTGQSISVDAFIERAERLRLDAKTFTDFILAPPPPDASFPGAPPCLVRMAKAGITSGGRNQALFTAAIYYKKADPDNAEHLSAAFNDQRFSPPLPLLEARSVVKAAHKKNFNYRCSEFPMSAFCDRTACEQMEFGVRHGKSAVAGELDLRLGGVIKIMTEPLVWRWEINGEWVDLTTEEFTTQRLFLRRVLEVTNARTRPVKANDWEAIVDEAVKCSVMEVPPPDATPAGQLMGHFSQFYTSKAQAKTLDEMLLHKAFTDADAQRVNFVVSDLIFYLSNQHLRGVTEKWIYMKLRDEGLNTHKAILKGKYVEYWSLPVPAVQSQEFDAPREEVAPL